MSEIVSAMSPGILAVSDKKRGQDAVPRELPFRRGNVSFPHPAARALPAAFPKGVCIST